ncbi:SurA N-terminal domain-containing protein [Campylobacter pinnipediorum]|uniref:SurA N-terminal domain-containing protein n=1 Tax=Campylobacter pinnipediorum TaxID=1965231 RepID=UPI00084DF42C|nr:SurA N-terminal domain-containing protein [Campylobacter pinnipediorum]AQW84563.1 putative periplasmic folding chaperone [Campylobacter pinnipediorum subsp. pinnipediorum]
MITWMQKRKKYLVVTIWISTIAFVGAGFVGWGAYDFNSNRSTSVAKVGHRNISVQELNEKYSQLFSYYNNVFNGQLSEEKASDMGLQNLALDASIRDSLLLNFADDIGLSVNDDDIIKYIVSDSNFQKDGVFDEKIYKDVLRRSRINPQDFEKNLKRSILIEKLSQAIRVSANDDDISMMSAIFNMKDEVAFKIVTISDNEIVIAKDEMKKFWKKNKNNYMTEDKYKFGSIFIPNGDLKASDDVLKSYYEDNKDSYRNSEDKIKSFEEAKDLVKRDYALQENKTAALKRYTELKKGEVQTTEDINFFASQTPFDIENLNKLSVGDVVKPIIYNNGYIILKLNEIEKSKTKTYDEAKDEVLEAFKLEKEKEILDAKVKKEIADFDVKKASVASISRTDQKDIDGLDMLESGNFIDHVFSSTNKKGYVVLDNKAVIYEILEQKLLFDSLVSDKKLVSENIATLKNNELIKDLTNALQKRYKVEEYIKR